MGVIRSIFSGQKKVETYQSIEDLPIYNWNKISETNNLNWLLVDIKDKKFADEALLNPLWDKIFYEYIDTFGIPEKMKQVFELKRDIQVLKWDVILTGDKSLETFIKIKEIDLAELTQKDNLEKQSTVNEVKVYVEKFMGFRIEEKSISVKEYYTYVAIMKKEQEQKSPPPQIKEEYGE